MGRQRVGVRVGYGIGAWVGIYTRHAQVFGFWSGSFVPQGKASRRVIAGPIARSDNTAMGCEGRAPGAENLGVAGIPRYPAVHDQLLQQ